MKSPKKIFVVLGTRPEAIKLAPLIRLLQKEKDGLEVMVCSTGQHRQMLDQVLLFFDIKPHVDLNLMLPNQSLSELTVRTISAITPILEKFRPSLVLVQGDTTTAYAAAVAAFYLKIPVGHIEAGLRTNDLYAPFPEEMNRRAISVVSKLHFAPTEGAKQSLLGEGFPAHTIFVTGNTVVDALLSGLSIIEGNVHLRQSLDFWFHKMIPAESRLILITGHRRESFGEGFESICAAIRELSQRYPGHMFIYPVHLNPNVQEPVLRILGGLKNVFLLEPVEYPKMLYLISKSYLILTDSGGVQEEAPSLKIPVLVMREKTERPEGVALGTSVLVGNSQDTIVDRATAYLGDEELYRKSQVGVNPYGDGQASRRIIDHLSKYLI